MNEISERLEIAEGDITTFVYGFPLERAARIALRQTQAFLQEDGTLQRVIMVCYGREAYDTFAAAYREIIGDDPEQV